MLVDYSSSSDDDDETAVAYGQDDVLQRMQNSTVEKKKCTQSLPSVPLDIVNMFSTSSQPIDNPTNHGGRQRSFQHERGNWATHVYVPFKAPPDFDEFLASLVGCLDCGWHAVDDFHISLSRTFPISFHWMDGLLQSLKAGISMRRFGVSFHGYEIYTNDEGTRSFLGLNVAAGQKQMHQLVDDVNRSLAEYKLPRYYDEPEFHMSVLWCLGDVRDTVDQRQHERLQSLLASHVDDLSFQADTAVMRSGNKYFNIPFS